MSPLSQSKLKTCLAWMAGSGWCWWVVLSLPGTRVSSYLIFGSSIVFQNDNQAPYKYEGQYIAGILARQVCCTVRTTYYHLCSIALKVFWHLFDDCPPRVWPGTKVSTETPTNVSSSVNGQYFNMGYKDANDQTVIVYLIDYSCLHISLTLLVI